jgi:hypothetical protein
MVIFFSSICNDYPSLFYLKSIVDACMFEEERASLGFQRYQLLPKLILLFRASRFRSRDPISCLSLSASSFFSGIAAVIPELLIALLVPFFFVSAFVQAPLLFSFSYFVLHPVADISGSSIPCYGLNASRNERFLLLHPSVP